jgi:hypothetical protein
MDCIFDKNKNYYIISSSKNVTDIFLQKINLKKEDMIILMNYGNNGKFETIKNHKNKIWITTSYIIYAKIKNQCKIPFLPILNQEQYNYYKNINIFKYIPEYDGKNCVYDVLCDEEKSDMGIIQNIEDYINSFSHILILDNFTLIPNNIKEDFFIEILKYKNIYKFSDIGNAQKIFYLANIFAQKYTINPTLGFKVYSLLKYFKCNNIFFVCFDGNNELIKRCCNDYVKTVHNLDKEYIIYSKDKNVKFIYNE